MSPKEKKLLDEIAKKHGYANWKARKKDVFEDSYFEDMELLAKNAVKEIGELREQNVKLIAMKSPHMEVKKEALDALIDSQTMDLKKQVLTLKKENGYLEALLSEEGSWDLEATYKEIKEVNPEMAEWFAKRWDLDKEVLK